MGGTGKRTRTATPHPHKPTAWSTQYATLLPHPTSATHRSTLRSPNAVRCNRQRSAVRCQTQRGAIADAARCNRQCSAVQPPTQPHAITKATTHTRRVSPAKRLEERTTHAILPPRGRGGRPIERTALVRALGTAREKEDTQKGQKHRAFQETLIPERHTEMPYTPLDTIPEQVFHCFSPDS